MSDNRMTIDELLAQSSLRDAEPPPPELAAAIHRLSEPDDENGQPGQDDDTGFSSGDETGRQIQERSPGTSTARRVRAAAAPLGDAPGAASAADAPTGRGVASRGVRPQKAFSIIGGIATAFLVILVAIVGFPGQSAQISSPDITRPPTQTRLSSPDIAPPPAQAGSPPAATPSPKPSGTVVTSPSGDSSPPASGTTPTADHPTATPPAPAKPVYLISLAENANTTWYSAAGEARFYDRYHVGVKDPRPHGYAAIYAAGWQTLEDGTRPEFLTMHPATDGIARWIAGNFILPAPIADGQHFRAAIGFHSGGSTGDVTFTVRAVLANGSVSDPLGSQHETQADGKMHDFDVDLSSATGATRLILRVEAGASPLQDLAAWVNPRIE